MTSARPATFALSPELALVDDELRERALALLPRVEAFDFLRFPPRPQPAEVVPLDAYRELSAALRARRRTVAVLAYFIFALARVCAFNVCVLVSVAFLVFLLNLAA